MKRLFLYTLLVLSLVSCGQRYEDFAIEGTVVDYQLCTNFPDLGYAVEISAPDSIGADYLASDSVIHHNVVVIYRADQILKDKQHISARIYLDPEFSRSECYYHYTQSLGEVPEACFTKLKVLD